MEDAAYQQRWIEARQAKVKTKDTWPEAMPVDTATVKACETWKGQATRLELENHELKKRGDALAGAIERLRMRQHECVGAEGETLETAVASVSVAKDDLNAALSAWRELA